MSQSAWDLDARIQNPTFSLGIENGVLTRIPLPT
jgi:hypothetical protein